MHLVGFNIEIYHDARSHERQLKLIYAALTILLSTPQNGMLLFYLFYTKDSDDRLLYKPSTLISL